MRTRDVVGLLLVVAALAGTTAWAIHEEQELRRWHHAAVVTDEQLKAEQARADRAMNDRNLTASLLANETRRFKIEKDRLTEALNMDTKIIEELTKELKQK
jgi:hypothetical protein